MPNALWVKIRKSTVLLTSQSHECWAADDLAPIVGFTHVVSYVTSCQVRDYQRAGVVSDQVGSFGQHAETLQWRHMSGMASEITVNSSVCSPACERYQQSKHQSPALLALNEGNHRWPVDSPHKRIVMLKAYPYDHGVIRDKRSPPLGIKRKQHDT